MAEEVKIDKTLDCIGFYCPEPVFRTRKALDEMKEGEVLEVLADDPSSKEDIPRLVKRLGHELIELKEEGEAFVFIIRKKGNESKG